MPDPPVGAASESRWKRSKDAAEAATAIAKAVLFLGAVALVATLIVTTVWRDRHARHVEVTVDAEADRTLREAGSQIDLRQAFIDVLNARVRGVQEIFTLHYAQLLDTREASDVSFKPFGLDASTGQVAQLVRELTGADPPITVRIELACPKAKCGSDGRADGTLLVTVVDRGGSERLAIPLGGRAEGLARSLREAMRRSASLLLERAEPLFAAVYDLNIAQQHIFLDDRSRDLQRAVTSALKLRDPGGTVSCIGNLVIGGSLFQRAAVEDGLVVEMRAGQTGDAVCEIHAATNIVFFLYPSVCIDDPGQRTFALGQARAALARIADRSLRGLADVVADRIPAAARVLDQMTFLDTQESVRKAACGSTSGGAADAAAVERYVTEQLAAIQRTLPPRASQRSAQPLLELLVDLQRTAMPADAILARYRTALATMRVIERYLPADATPRRLFFLRGRLATAMAAVADDALAIDEPARQALLRGAGFTPPSGMTDTGPLFLGEARARLLEAKVDFENGQAAEGSPQIGEVIADVALATAAGDAALALGDVVAARASYGRAVEEFLASDTPVDQLVPLADVVTRLVGLDRATGACTPSADAGRATVRSAARQLGMTQAEWCGLGTAAGPARPAFAGVLASFVRRSDDACGPLQVAAPAAPDAAFKSLRCRSEHGAAKPRDVAEILRDQTGAAVRLAIQDALPGASSGGE